VEDLGQRLRRYREDRGWTQAVLAEQAGVSKPYLSELEGGAGRRPSGEILLKLADAGPGIGRLRSVLATAGGVLTLQPDHHLDARRRPEGIVPAATGGP
jgi:transcriptional regulator with XRE-family HTH domain